MFKLNDTFVQGEARLQQKLAECPPPELEAYRPQHDKAHVRMPVVGHRNGYPICYLTSKRES